MNMDGGGDTDLIESSSKIGRGLLWSDLGSLLANVTSASTVGELNLSLGKLHALSDSQLCSFLCSKEGISLVKSNIVNESKDLRHLCIESFGQMIIRGWICLHDNIDLEGFIRAESRSEARRLREDFIDMAIDVFKNFASGAIGKAPSSDPAKTLEDEVPGMSIYCKVLARLLDCYNASFEPLNGWIDALLGVSGSGSKNVQARSQLTWRQQSLSLIPLMKPFLNVAFSDPYLLISRAKLLPSYRNGAVPLVTGFCKVLLNELNRTSSLSSVLDLSSTKNYQQMFATGDADVTLDSRSGDLPLPVVLYVTQWVRTTLHYLLQDSPYLWETTAVVKDVIILTQHTLMSDCRCQVSLDVIHKLFFLLESNRLHDSAVYDELICLTLLTVRYIHISSSASYGEAPALLNTVTGSTAPTSIYPFLMRLLKLLFKVTDSVLQTRLFAEFATLLLDASIDPVAPNGANERYDFAKNAMAMLLTESDKMDIRLIVSLFRVLERGILLTSQVLMDFQSAFATSRTDDTTSGAKDAAADALSDLSMLPSPKRDADNTGSSGSGGHANDRADDHPWVIFDHELFLSKNRLYRHRVKMLTDSAILPPALEEDWVQESLKELREYLCRLLCGGVYVIKLAALNYLKKSASGVIGDAAAQGAVSLMDTVSSILLVASDGPSHSSRLKKHLINNSYAQVVRSLAHELTTHYDQMVEGLLKISSTPTFSVLCLEPHMLRFNLLLVRRMAVTTRIVGSTDFSQSVVSYLSLVLQQPETRKKQTLAALREAMEEGTVVGGKDMDMTGGANHQQCAALMLHTLDLVVLLAQECRKDAAVGRACLALLQKSQKEMTHHILDEHHASVIRSPVVAERVSRAIQELMLFVPPPKESPRAVSETATVKGLLRESIARCEDRQDFESILHSTVSLMYEEAVASVTTGTEPSSGASVLSPSAQNSGMTTTSAGMSLLDLHVADGAATAAAAGGVCRLDLVCELAVVGYQVSDHSKECGVFSRDTPTYSDRTQYGAKIYETCADLYAAIDDVIDAHMFTDTSSSAASQKDGSGNNNVGAALISSSGRRCSSVDWSEATVAPRELPWTQLSGSSDVLTVLASSDFSPLDSQVTVHVRVYNSSGFKIPFFALHVMLQSNLAGANVTASNMATNGLTAVYDTDAIIQATGMEYFLIDSYIERTFRFKVVQFAPIDVMIRVVYPDLTYDDEDLFEVPVENAKTDSKGGAGGGGGHKTRQKRSKFTTALTAGFFNGYVPFAVSDGAKYTALIQCAPLRVQVASQLMPYGGGVMSNLYYWKRQRTSATRHSETHRPGIPQAVFHSMWNRLEGRKSDFRVIVEGSIPRDTKHSVLTLLESAQIYQSITAAIVESVHMCGGGSGVLGMDGRVLVNGRHDNVLEVFAAEAVGTRVEPFVAWCHQTIWGAEVASRLVLLPSTADKHEGMLNPLQGAGLIKTVKSSLDPFAAMPSSSAAAGESQKWRASLEIRCTDRNTCCAIVLDINNFIRALGGGSFRLVH